MLATKRIPMISLIVVVFLAGFADFALAADDIPLVINELMASNNSTIQDPQNQYDDWIEIYNFGSSAVDVGSMYLTDDLSEPTKWQFPANNPTATVIPAHGYLLVWVDNDTDDAGMHASFQLSAGGEEIGLFDTDESTLIDSITFGQQTADISYGRYPDANDNLQYMATPTPGGKNNGGYIDVVADPEFSQRRGFYDVPFSVSLTTETDGAVIYYTLTGSEPGTLSDRGERVDSMYTSPLSITKTTCIRAQAIKAGWKSSNIVTCTYIFLDDAIKQPRYPEGFPRDWGRNVVDYQMDPDVVNDPAYAPTIKEDLKTIPSIAIAIDNDDFFSAERGIYANAENRGIDWERHASIEWIDPVKDIDFQVNAGLRTHGGVGRSSSVAKHSLRILFKNEYGPSRLEFPLFEDSDVDIFESLVLRALWNYSYFGDSTACGGLGTDHAQYLRDQVARDEVRDMGGLTPYGRHVHLYINGLYWGLYVLTERPDDGFAAEHLGGSKEDYDVLKASNSFGAASMEVIAGDLNAWNTLFNLATGDLSSKEAYEEIQQYVDIPAMIDYLLMVYHVGSRDAPVLLCNDQIPRNFYALRRREPSGPFIFLPWDVEWILESPYENRVRIVGVYNPHYLLNRLMRNADFRILLADHIHQRFFNDGALTPANSIERYMARANDIDRAIIGESARWGDSKRSNRPYTRDVEWVAERDRLVDEYFPIRTDIVLDQLRQAGFYPDVPAPVFFVNDSYQHGGYISSLDRFSMTAPMGTIYYTLDGSDPRLSGLSVETTTSTVLVDENAAKKVLVPTEDISNDWINLLRFNDSSWLSGTGAVGYEAGSGYEELISIDVGGQMYNGNTSCYIRIPFTVGENLNSFNFLTLNMRYDDGFIAYINGTEVQRVLFTGTPAWNSQADGNHEAQDFESFDISAHLNTLQQGENILAIHGLNVSTTSSDFLISAELVAGVSSTHADIGLSPTAIEYTEPVTLTKSTHVKSRVLDGSTWSALNEATFAVGPVAENLRITEIMYHPEADPNEEFIELKNIGTETINLNLAKFTNGIDFTFPDIDLAPGAYIVIVRNLTAFTARYGTEVNTAGQYSGSLNDAGERIELEDAIGQTILDFSYSDNWRNITDGDGFSLTIIDASNSDPNNWDKKDSWRASAYIGGSPGWDDSGIIPNPGAVVINELLANSPAGAADWIELYNTTETSIDIGGWFLSDSSSNPSAALGTGLTKYEIADGTTIAPHGYIVFYEDTHFDNTNDPGCHTPFALSGNGETVYLTSAQDGVLTGYRQSEDFGPSASGVSFGRYYKSSTDNFNFVAMRENTPGLANAYPKVGPIVISEIMYNPASGNQNEEYIELYNISSEPVTLYDYDKQAPWKFTDGIDFTFPADVPVTIPAGGHLLVVKNPSVFALTYIDTAAGVQVLGPYDGQLSNNGEKAELSMPGELDGDGSRYYIRLDLVSYSDGSHPGNCPGGVDLWPVEADGGGSSLGRRVAEEYGNDVANWQAASPSPGR
jgi:hypothetical protein